VKTTTPLPTRSATQIVPGNGSCAPRAVTSSGSEAADENNTVSEVTAVPSGLSRMR
jgi:hypothetical protein